MNQDSMKRLFDAWRWVRDAEEAVAEFLYGDGDEGILIDVLGVLIDAKDNLGELVAEHIGEPANEIDEKVMQAERVRFGIAPKDGE